MPALDIADCINQTCPWSGKPTQADSLTTYGGQVVGFCNTGCRDKFERAIGHFEEARSLAAGSGHGARSEHPGGEDSREPPMPHK